MEVIMESIIKVEKAYKKYQMKDRIVIALDSVDASFERGKFYVIVGESGSGKSTFIQSIGLLDDLTTGKILIDGQDVSKLNSFEKARIRKNKIGFVFQSFYLNPLMKAYENVMLPLYLNKSMSQVERKEKAMTLLKKVGLEERMYHYPKELSGGEQQRVAIARALANDPEILLADEPTGNLDKKNEKIILDIFKQLKEENKCVVVVTHNDRVLEYADSQLIMDSGVLEEHV